MLKNEIKFLWVLAPGLLMAALPSAQPDCVNGTRLQSFIDDSMNQSGCKLGGNFRLSKWAYLTAGTFTSPIAPIDITVTFGTGASGPPSVTFTGNWRADAASDTSKAVGVIAFSVEAIDKRSSMAGVNFAATGSVSPLAPAPLVPSGAANVSEISCVGGLTKLRDPQNIFRLLPPPANLKDVGCSGVSSARGEIHLPAGTNVVADGALQFDSPTQSVDIALVLTVWDLVNNSSTGWEPGVNGFGQIRSVAQLFQSAHESRSDDLPTASVILLISIGVLLIGYTLRFALQFAR